MRQRYQQSPQFNRLAGWTRKSYLAWLDGLIGPEFDRAKIGTVDAAAVARFTTQLEQRTTPSGSKPRQSTVQKQHQPLRLQRHAHPRREGGLRLGECLGLDFADCELVKGAGMINVRRQWTRMKELQPPKAGSRRAVPISDELVRLLLEWKMAAPDKSGPMFGSRTGGRLSHRNVERRGFDPAATDAGLEGVTFHDLRHARGSRLASKGLSARAIADAMGHEKIATTEIYIQRFNGPQADEKVRRAMTG